jgi:hypothetical protein
MARRSDRGAGMKADEVPRPLLPWLRLEHEPVLDKESQEQIRGALKRLQI